MIPLGALDRTAQALKKAAPQLRALKDSCDALESNFFKQMLTEMRKTVHSVQLGDSLGGDTYQDMFDEAFANSMSKGGSLGLSQMAYRPMANQVIAQALAKEAKTGLQTAQPAANAAHSTTTPASFGATTQEDEPTR